MATCIVTKAAASAAPPPRGPQLPRSPRRAAAAARAWGTPARARSPPAAPSSTQRAASLCIQNRWKTRLKSGWRSRGMFARK
eukprot:554604-Prorocentrum_minimum.AAC.2